MSQIRSFILVAALSVAGVLFVPMAVQASCIPRVADSELIRPGTLVMSTNPTLPPLQFVDAQGQLRGMRIELGNEIARRLCLTPEYIRIEFSAMIPGLAARRWDMINTGIFYTEERARIMYMIRYENQAISFSAPRGNPRNIRRVEDLAGLTVGVEIGGFEERRTRELSERLVAQGLRPLNIRTFDNFAVAYQALRAGQVDVVTSIDGVAAEYDQRGEFPRVLHGLFPTPVSLAFRSRGLAEAVNAVLQEMTADGSLQALFDRYGASRYTDPLVVVGPSL